MVDKKKSLQSNGGNIYINLENKFIICLFALNMITHNLNNLSLHKILEFNLHFYSQSEIVELCNNEYIIMGLWKH